MSLPKSKKKKKSNVADKDYSISDIVALVDQNFGAGMLMTMSSRPMLDLPVISTGSLSLDLALGIGGLPKGRIVEIYGPEASGKTTCCLHVMANAQKEGGKVAFIDTEHALDPAYAASIGVNVDELLFAQPDCGEEALELVETLLRTRALDAIIIDSIASLVPRAEIEGQMGDSHVGLQARLMSQACRKLAPKAKQADTLVMFTNQIREKIGVMFGSPEVTPGGKAMKFYASVRMDIRRIGQIKEGSDKDADVIGNKVRIKVVKNKVGPAFKKAETRIMTDGLGFDDTYDCINMGLKYGLLKQKGSWYSYGDESLAQGMESLKDLLNEPQNEEFLAELRQDIINIHYSQFEEEIEEEEEEEEPKKKKKKKSKKKKKKSKNKGK